MTFGERLREIRKQCNLTQTELADRIKLSTANISKYEKGALEPSLDTLIAISSALNVSIDYLLGINMGNSSGGSSLTAPKISSDVAAINEYYNKLSGNGKEKALEYIEMLKELEERKGDKTVIPSLH